jgi:TonB family protein
VLGHELAHVARGDWALQILAELVRALCWFNPFVWIACASLRRDSEHACDDAVLNLGIERTEYAAHLVDLARACRTPRGFVHQLSAPGMAHASTLEQRIRAMLNDHANRRPLTGSVRLLAAVVLALLTVPIAGYGAQQYATVSGTLLDASNGRLPGATLTLVNVETRAKQEVHSDRTGYFEFVGLPAGSYDLGAFLPGFKPLQDRLMIAPGQIVQRTVTLQIGQLEETLQVTEGDEEAPPHAFKPVPPVPARCGNAAATSGPAIGGQIKTPTKLTDAHPVFPANLKGTKASGVVLLDARISTDGFIKDVRVIGGGNSDFQQAAITALRQWQFSPTLLNCVPVEVTMTVTINFAGE